MSFFVFIFDAIFCGTNFFIFEDSVWLVKSSWCELKKSAQPQLFAMAQLQFS